MLDCAISLQYALELRTRFPAIVDAIKRINMRPKEPRNSDAHDLFRSRLDQIVDLDHPLAKLARVIDWDFLVT